MPKIVVQGKIITCQRGANLRKVLLEHGIELYNGKAKIINCLGIGTCGTCAVGIEGKIASANWKDRTRRSLPPHCATKDRRLACQIEVADDIQVSKYDGFWGQGDEKIW